ncbi:MAG: hypothetical protein ABSH08_13310, partial [Tepidisphaeraceae bacterium]
IEALNPNIEATLEVVASDGAMLNRVKVIRFADGDGYSAWSVVKEDTLAETAIAQALAEAKEWLQYEATLTE